MMPEAVWAGDLVIDEAVRRLPLGDLRCPAQRDHTPAQRVLDQCSLPNLTFGDTHNSKVQPRRRDRLQVMSDREESEDFVDRTRNALLTLKNVRGHRRC